MYRIPNVSLIACLLGVLGASSALAQPTAFTYQGELKSGGVPANGLYDFQFKLYDAAAGGLSASPFFCVDNVQVTNGKFTARIDFGPAYVTPGARYIEVGVRQDTGLDCTNTTGFATLSPRTEVTAAPFATYANKASELTSVNGNGAAVVSVDTSGRVGIGMLNPTHTLHIANAAPTIALQDTNSGGGTPSGDQVGYVSYRDIGNVERAWVGFGLAGDPDFSIINARPGGDIVLNTLGGGKVGIGTGSPAAMLDVRGDVKLGTSGQFFATSGEENLKFIRGTVSVSGTVFTGSGWTVSRSATGQYTVLYTTPFANVPTVTATTAGTGGNVANITSNNTLGFTYSTYNSAGSLIDLGVYFTAVGPRN